MKIIIYGSAAALLLILSGCAEFAPGGSGSDWLEGSGAAGSGQAETPPGGYSQVLSNPGPF